MELKNSPNFIHTWKMEEYRHHLMGALAGPCAFSTKATHPRTHRDHPGLILIFCRQF
jgi:hypothetical protein